MLGNIDRHLSGSNWPDFLADYGETLGTCELSHLKSRMDGLDGASWETQGYYMASSKSYHINKHLHTHTHLYVYEKVSIIGVLHAA